jgi:hypothetical protein
MSDTAVRTSDTEREGERARERRERKRETLQMISFL